MRTHVADSGGLTGGSSRGCCGGSFHLTCTDATDKAPADFSGGVQVSAGKCAGPGDESPRPIVIRSLGLKQPQDSLGAVGGPCGNKAAVRFAQRLWRRHQTDCHAPYEVRVVVSPSLAESSVYSPQPSQKCLISAHCSAVVALP